MANKKTPPLEKTIVASILRWLKEQQATFCWKEHGGPYGTPGIPDIIVCHHGAFVALEVKRPGGKPTKLQEATIQAIRRSGGWAFVVHSLEEARERLDQVRELTAYIEGE